MSFTNRIACLLLVLGGCRGTGQNIDPAGAPRLDAATGVVVGTVTARNYQHYHDLVSFRFRRVGGGPDGRFDSAVPRVVFPMLESAPDAGLERENGLIFARELPVGTYEIHEVRLNNRKILLPSSPPRFEVRPAEVVYLGGLDVAFEGGMVSSTRGGILGGTPTVTNQAPRDLPLIRARFPAFAQLEIVPRLVDDTGITWRREH